MSREKFENLPRVKPILRLVKYSESSDGYDPLDQKSIYEKYADWLNGAWYAFQEQQTKINAVLQYLDTGDHPLDFSANTIRELLK